MNCLFSQIILAARSQENDERGWMQLLILIIVGVVYGIATLARAKANKVNLEKEEPAAPPKDKPRYKPVEQWSAPRRSADRRAAEEGLQVSTQRPPPHLPVQRAQRQPGPQPAKRPVVRKKPPLVPEQIGLPAKPALGRVMPDLSMPKLGRIKKLETKLRPIAEQEQPEPTEKPAFTPLLGYEEPNPLRAAILYYEILGKPLSLRDRSQERF